MSSFYQEFKAFINRGNVIDMAVGIIIGASFGKIVNTLVNNVLMPPLGFILGGMDFSDFKLTIKKATEVSEAITIDYGLFINSLINFFIVSCSIFLIIKGLYFFKKRTESESKTCPHCFMKVNHKAKRCPFCTSTDI
ncbi:MAG: large-conductance mechanosensitive channel protein MscL [Chlamydiota bacterium]|jgi:large conductance mechanosensitive channel